jgi:hypothetical protein
MLAKVFKRVNKHGHHPPPRLGWRLLGSRPCPEDVRSGAQGGCRPQNRPGSPGRVRGEEDRERSHPLLGDASRWPPPAKGALRPLGHSPAQAGSCGCRAMPTALSFARHPSVPVPTSSALFQVSRRAVLRFPAGPLGSRPFHRLGRGIPSSSHAVLRLDTGGG